VLDGGDGDDEYCNIRDMSQPDCHIFQIEIWVMTDLAFVWLQSLEVLLLMLP
jgi:hypothetical protein